MKTTCSLLLLAITLAFTSCSHDKTRCLPSLTGLTFSDVVVEGDDPITKIIATDLKVLLVKAGAKLTEDGRLLTVTAHSSLTKWKDDTYNGSEKATVALTIDFPEGGLTRTDYSMVTTGQPTDNVVLAYNTAVNLVLKMPSINPPSK